MDRQNATLATPGGQPPHHYDRTSTCWKCGEACAAGTWTCAACLYALDRQEGRL